MWEDLSMEESVKGEENSIKKAQDFLALFKKNNEKTNKKKFCSSESKEQH